MIAVIDKVVRKIASNTIDTLSIEITSTSQKANRSIDTLVSNLGKLNTALGNYRDASQGYGRAMNNLSSGLADLGRSINSLDADKLGKVAKSMNALVNATSSLKSAFGNTGMNKAASDAKLLDAEIERISKRFMEMYGTSSQVAERVQSDMKRIMSGMTLDKAGNVKGFSQNGLKAMMDLTSTLSQNVKQQAMTDGEEYAARFLEGLKQLRGGRVKIPFNISDMLYVDNQQDANALLSKIFGVGGWTMKGTGLTELHEYAAELERITGMKIPTDGNPADIVNSIATAMRAAEVTMESFNQKVVTADISSTQLETDLVQAKIGLDQFAASLAKSNNTANPFAMLGESLQALPSQIPDLTGLATLAANISKLGGKSAQQGITNLPLLIQGLGGLSGLTIPELPNIESLSNLIVAFNKLGNKTGTGAAANIQPMIDGLKQLGALSGLKFPDGTGLASFAQAFTILGRETTGRAVQNIPQLADSFKQLVTALSTAPKVSDNVIRLAEAMAKLSANGSKVGSASKTFVNSLSNINTRSQGLTSRLLQLGKGLLTSGRHASTAGSRYSTLASKIGLLYAKFWMLLRVIRLVNRIISVASALTEVQNVVDTTFGVMSYKIEEFSKTAIKSFGMSELSAKQYASRFQAMGTSMGITGAQVQKAQSLFANTKTLQGAEVGYNKLSNSMADMSVNLTKLTADMASFYNVDQETVAKALQSGVMAGQTRPLILAA